jgi:STE24 endopeptidase
MNSIYFYIIIWLFIIEFLFTRFLDYLNTTKWSSVLPEEWKEIYSKEEYKKSMEYEKTNHNFSKITSIYTFVIMLAILYLWYFWQLYDHISVYTDNTIIQTLYFFWTIFIIQTIITIPFTYYQNFVIEEKFGFNKMTKKLFCIDLIKSILLTFIIWWILISIVTWLYWMDQNNFWIYAWLLSTFVTLFIMMFYSSVIVPIFNKQTLLKEWKLRDEIEKFAKKVWFKLDNIYVIDGSKRSSKANAYFSWFWPKKRIVLYDTLIKDLTNSELVGVLAHEIWHYKKKHTFQMLAFSIIQSGIMLFILGLALKMPEISQALWSSESNFAVWIVAFWILFTPISIIFSLLGNIISRKNEYQADNFAWINYEPKQLINALIKLSKNNLSNLKPHSVYEFFNYSHPTVLKRINALKNIRKNK